MTLPRNSPGRKNERRIGALCRIERQLVSDTRRSSGNEYPLAAGDRSRLSKEADTLALRIRPAEQMRAVRTKKDRSGTGRLTRP